MAEKSDAPLKNTFKEAAGHLFSPWMIIMMLFMALPMVAAAAPAGVATFGDLFKGMIDMYISMFTAPFTDGGIIGDAFGNAADGVWSGDSYQMGMHDAHTGADHVMDDAAAHGHAGPEMEQVAACGSDFSGTRSDWFYSDDCLSNADRQTYIEAANNAGMSVADYTSGQPNPHHPQHAPLPEPWA